MTQVATRATFTPGPWTTEEDKIIAVGIQSVVAVVDIYDRDAPIEEQNANARLMAAAPDLYRALVEMMREYEPVGMNLRPEEDDVPDAVFLAREAIRLVG